MRQQQSENLLQNAGQNLGAVQHLELQQKKLGIPSLKDISKAMADIDYGVMTCVMPVNSEMLDDCLKQSGKPPEFEKPLK